MSTRRIANWAAIGAQVGNPTVSTERRIFWAHCTDDTYGCGHRHFTMPVLALDAAQARTSALAQLSEWESLHRIVDPLEHDHADRPVSP